MIKNIEHILIKKFFLHSWSKIFCIIFFSIFNAQVYIQDDATLYLKDSTVIHISPEVIHLNVDKSLSPQNVKGISRIYIIKGTLVNNLSTITNAQIVYRDLQMQRKEKKCEKIILTQARLKERIPLQDKDKSLYTNHCNVSAKSNISLQKTEITNAIISTSNTNFNKFCQISPLFKKSIIHFYSKWCKINIKAIPQSLNFLSIVILRLRPPPTHFLI